MLTETKALTVKQQKQAVQKFAREKRADLELMRPMTAAAFTRENLDHIKIERSDSTILRWLKETELKFASDAAKKIKTAEQYAIAAAIATWQAIYHSPALDERKKLCAATERLLGVHIGNERDFDTLIKPLRDCGFIVDDGRASWSEKNLHPNVEKLLTGTLSMSDFEGLEVSYDPGKSYENLTYQQVKYLPVPELLMGVSPASSLRICDVPENEIERIADNLRKESHRLNPKFGVQVISKEKKIILFMER